MITKVTPKKATKTKKQQQSSRKSAPKSKRSAKKARAAKVPVPKTIISAKALEEIVEYSATSDEPLSDETLVEVAMAGAVDPERYLDFHRYLAQRHAGESGEEIFVFTELFDTSD